MAYNDLPEHDKALIESANRKRWEDIDEDEAISIEGKQILHDMAIRGMHMSELKEGIL